MKILILHNRYQQRGGEDVVFETENDLLAKNGHSVSSLIFDNKEIKSVKDSILTGLRSIYNPKSARILEAKIKESKPDVIHVHNFFPLASPSVFFTAQKYKIPVIITVHNYRLLCPSTFLFFRDSIYEKSIHKIFPVDAIVKKVYRNSMLQTGVLVLMTGIHKLLGTWRTKVDKYIILTEFAKAKFIDSSLNIDGQQIIVKPNSVADRGVKYGVRENFFLFVGRLSAEKGIEVLLRATEKFSFKLKIIGDGPLRELVEQYAARNPDIEYLGFQEHSVIINEMKKSSALIFPSIWYEMFGMSILEAFSTGTPVIASRLGGPAEIVRDGYNGFLFKPNSANQLAQKVQRILENPALAGKLGEQARQTYEQYYSPNANYEQLIRTYQEAIQEKRLSTANVAKTGALPVRLAKTELHKSLQRLFM